MKSVLCREWGGADKLRVEDRPSLKPGIGEIRIAVHACGVNFADSLMIEGKYQERPEFPFSPGLEAAGVCLEIGEGVQDFSAGDRVITLCGHGGYAEEVLAPATTTVRIPDEMDFVSAAGFTVAYGTAHLALDLRAQLKAGEVLLVHGAAGGVGLAAVEIGKAMGAMVIATASSEEKLRLADAHGADYLINYRETEFREDVKKLSGGRGADVIFDPVGGDVFDQSIRCINWGGRIVAVGFASGSIPQAPVNQVLVKNFSVVGVYWAGYSKRQPGIITDSLQTLLEWFVEGKLKPHVSQTYPLESAAEAIHHLTSRRSSGKLVLVMKD